MEIKEAVTMLANYSFALAGDPAQCNLFTKDVDEGRLAEAIATVLNELEVQSQAVIAMGAIADNYKEISIEATNDINAVICGETYVCGICGNSDNNKPCGGSCSKDGIWRGLVASK